MKLLMIRKNLLKIFSNTTIFFTILLTPNLARSVFLDGEGHYSLQPGTQTNPGFSKDRGLYQATKESFGLLGNIRGGDKLEFKFNLRLFDPVTSYLGDSSQPQECSHLANDDDGRKKNDPRGTSRSCENRYQNTSEPGYRPYTPFVTEAYVEYGFDYCLLQAGRRGRDWGMGIFLDSGRSPFAESASIFDGVTCKVNALKAESLSFAVGFDRLAETGHSIDVGLPTNEDRSIYGPSKTSDDLDQIYFSVELDDRKQNPEAKFSRQIGFYVANVFGTAKIGEDPKNSARSDVHFADLYAAFFLGGFTARHEFLFRLGKSADPNWTRMGGVSSDSSSDVGKNKVDAIGVAGELKYDFAKSGSYVGPKEYREGNASMHSVFTQYGYAPGDRDGYYDEDTRRERHLRRVSAIAFHRNFKPALILFNGNHEMDDMRVDGIFDPGRVMNAWYATLGYRYSSLKYGNFETKFVTAQLNVNAPREIRESIAADEANAADKDHLPRRPVGYSGKHLGYELDLSYTRPIGKSVELGGASAIAIPGPAWRTEKGSTPETSYLLLGTATFKF